MGNTYILELDGKPVARLLSLDSTGINIQVITSPQHYGVRSSKILTGAPGEVKFKFGADAFRTLLDWASGPVGVRKSGAIEIVDSRSVVLHRIEFFDAMITSFFLPAVDRSSRAAALFSASFQPDKLVHTAGTGKLTTGSSVVPAPKQWNASNFRFNIGGLPIDDGAVTRVSTFGLNKGVKAFYTGSERSPYFEPTRTSFSNVVVALPVSRASGILSWVEETVGGGHLTTPSEKKASLEYLAPGDKIRYYTAEFSGLGVASSSLSKSSGESGKELITELYYDSVKLVY